MDIAGMPRPRIEFEKRTVSRMDIRAVSADFTSEPAPPDLPHGRRDGLLHHAHRRRRERTEVDPRRPAHIPSMREVARDELIHGYLLAKHTPHPLPLQARVQETRSAVIDAEVHGKRPVGMRRLNDETVLRTPEPREKLFRRHVAFRKKLHPLAARHIRPLDANARNAVLTEIPHPVVEFLAASDDMMRKEERPLSDGGE